jgi:hypothetical protein
MRVMRTVKVMNTVEMRAWICKVWQSCCSRRVIKRVVMVMVAYLKNRLLSNLGKGRERLWKVVKWGMRDNLHNARRTWMWFSGAQRLSHSHLQNPFELFLLSHSSCWLKIGLWNSNLCICFYSPKIFLYGLGGSNKVDLRISTFKHMHRRSKMCTVRDCMSAPWQNLKFWIGRSLDIISIYGERQRPTIFVRWLWP